MKALRQLKKEWEEKERKRKEKEERERREREERERREKEEQERIEELKRIGKYNAELEEKRRLERERIEKEEREERERAEREAEELEERLKNEKELSLRIAKEEIERKEREEKEKQGKMKVDRSRSGRILSAKTSLTGKEIFDADNNPFETLDSIAGKEIVKIVDNSSLALLKTPRLLHGLGKQVLETPRDVQERLGDIHAPISNTDRLKLTLGSPHSPFIFVSFVFLSQFFPSKYVQANALAI
jgi:hypothetical protein